MGVLIALLLSAAGAAKPAWATSSVTFVQATIVAPDAAAGTLGFVDASGRSRSHRVSGEFAPRLGRLRAGDEVILVLSGTDPVVQDVRVSLAAPAVPSPEAAAEAAAPTASPWTVVPPEQMRKTWPNPYSRFNRGKAARSAATNR
ncbi:MAG TPA: hypothetical protein VIG50_19135 [Vicinamibacteria bacterium]